MQCWRSRRYVGDERSFVLDCFTAYCTLALLHLILNPACFHLHRRTPPALSVNLSSWFFPEYTPANIMLSPSSFIQHSSGTLFLHKTSLVLINLRQALKHTGQHTNTPPSFATIFMISCWTMLDAKLHRSSSTCNSLSYAFFSLPYSSSLNQLY